MSSKTIKYTPAQKYMTTLKKEKKDTIYNF